MSQQCTWQLDDIRQAGCFTSVNLLVVYEAGYMPSGTGNLNKKLSTDYATASLQYGCLYCKWPSLAIKTIKRILLFLYSYYSYSECLSLGWILIHSGQISHKIKAAFFFFFMSHSLRREAALKQSLHCSTITILQILIWYSHGYLPSIKNTLTLFFFFTLNYTTKTIKTVVPLLSTGAARINKKRTTVSGTRKSSHANLRQAPLLVPLVWPWAPSDPADLSHSGHIDLSIAAVANYIDDCCNFIQVCRCRGSSIVYSGSTGTST